MMWYAPFSTALACLITFNETRTVGGTTFLIGGLDALYMGTYLFERTTALRCLFRLSANVRWITCDLTWTWRSYNELPISRLISVVLIL